MLAQMWQTAPLTPISATNSLSLQLVVPIDLLYTGGTPSTTHGNADLLRRACAQPQARPRSPSRTLLHPGVRFVESTTIPSVVTSPSTFPPARIPGLSQTHPSPLGVHVPLSPSHSCRCPMIPADCHVPLSPSHSWDCPMTVEGAPESRCLLRCGRLPHSPRFQLRNRPIRNLPSQSISCTRVLHRQRSAGRLTF